jgi:Cu+-exporting ATPase
MKVNGMSCGHCSAHVEKALNAIEGVKATVDLAKATAEIELSQDIREEVLRNAVKDAGYEPEGIVYL